MNVTAEALAAAMWDADETFEPSGREVGTCEEDRHREPIFWEEAVRTDLWPSSRRDMITKAERVLDLLAHASEASGRPAVSEYGRHFRQTTDHLHATAYDHLGNEIGPRTDVVAHSDEGCTCRAFSGACNCPVHGFDASECGRPRATALGQEGSS